MSLCWSSQGFLVSHYRLCFLQCGWWREIFFQKVINVDEAPGMSPDLSSCGCGLGIIGTVYCSITWKASYRLFARAQFPQDFWEFCAESAPLHQSPQGMLTSPVWRMPATSHTLCWQCRGSNEGSHLFDCMNYPHVHLFQLNARAHDWCNLSLWSLLIVLNKAMQTLAFSSQNTSF